MKRFAGLASLDRVVALSSLGMCVLLILPLLKALVTEGVPDDLADKDFSNYWIAGRLVLEGRTADLFGPQPIYFAHLQHAFGDDYGWHNWSYPPHMLLVLWPLGFFGYEAALLVFLAATGALFLWALRAFAGSRNIMALVAAGPFAAHNLWVAQNGFLTAGLGLGALALRERRPVLAGVLLGLLTVKPQLGILFPFLLLAERRWVVLASATATASVLVAASVVLFGVSAWTGYVQDVVPYQAFVMREMEGSFLAMMPSVFGMLRNWHVGPDLALTLHLAAALPAALLAIAAFFTLQGARERSAVLLVATFLVTPYALTYDLGLFVLGVALIAGTGRPGEPHGKFPVLLIALAMLLPAIMTPLGEFKLSIAPAIVMAMLALALNQAGFFGLRDSRFAAVSPASSPGAASD